MTFRSPANACGSLTPVAALLLSLLFFFFLISMYTASLYLCGCVHAVKGRRGRYSGGEKGRLNPSLFSLSTTRDPDVVFTPLTIPPDLRRARYQRRTHSGELPKISRRVLFSFFFSIGLFLIISSCVFSHNVAEPMEHGYSKTDIQVT